MIEGTADLASDEAAPEDVRELDAAIERYMAIGYAENVVIQGLKAATGDPGLAGIVMESVTPGKGVPTHHEGIWTKRDDEWLALIASVDFESEPNSEAERKTRERAEKVRKKLEHKHGVERMEARSDFLMTSNRFQK